MYCTDLSPERQIRLHLGKFCMVDTWVSDHARHRRLCLRPVGRQSEHERGRYRSAVSASRWARRSPSIAVRRREAPPGMSRLSWMTCASFALPAADRCDRPSTASERISGVHPGRLAQGPDEKCGRTGRNAGLFILTSLPERRAPVGERGPRLPSHGPGRIVNRSKKGAARAPPVGAPARYVLSSRSVLGELLLHGRRTAG